MWISLEDGVLVDSKADREMRGNEEAECLVRSCVL